MTNAQTRHPMHTHEMCSAPSLLGTAPPPLKRAEQKDVGPDCSERFHHHHCALFRIMLVMTTLHVPLPHPAHEDMGMTTPRSVVTDKPPRRFAIS